MLIGYSQLLLRHDHARGLHAADLHFLQYGLLPRMPVDIARPNRTECHPLADGDIRRTAYDRLRPIVSQANRDQDKPLRVRMWLYVDDLRDGDTRPVARRGDDRAHLYACRREATSKLFGREHEVNVICQPAMRYSHRGTVIPAAGNARRSRRIVVCRLRLG